MGSRQCFVCGADNPFGLHLEFFRQDDGVYASFQCEERHVGWPGIQHGGITSALLDEASAYIPYYLGLIAVTAQLTVTYVEPVRIGEHLEIKARLVRKTRKVLDVEATIANDRGSLKAKSQAKMMVLSEEQKQQIGLFSQTTAGSET
ncbi:PaaI family thioesterase [Alicyclobacillus tolerans]|uniref:PaaI family thioesterase n=1 Tax=Alicyclobacillus tolerans TaxID=90970 RepID=UPI001F48D8B2|nr:PaaI family thioesterase [Alicyclobacillus tolerans]MCF8565853.1 PaaI family thioesterase [Alicyclobacillus tolerans]